MSAIPAIKARYLHSSETTSYCLRERPCTSSKSCAMASYVSNLCRII